MTNVYVLEPHHDDAALFSCFNAIREQAAVITVLKSYVQEQRGDGITHAMREYESVQAIMGVLGLQHVQWEFRDDAPDWAGISLAIAELDASRIYVPAYEQNGGGHPHHDRLFQAAHESCDGEVVPYLTYSRAGKSKWGTPVPYEPAWVPLKMRALLCYESQVAHPLQVEHFLRSYREYVV